MALAKGLVLLGVESLSFQVDLTYLGTAKASPLELGGGRRGPFPTFHESKRQVVGEEHRALGVGPESQGALTAHTKHVSCQLKPSASRKRSPASILKSQPRHFVPNIFS